MELIRSPGGHAAAMADKHGIYRYHIHCRDDSRTSGNQYCFLRGTRTAGIPGTVIATMSYVLPALIIVMILAKVYYKCRDLNGVQGVLKGLRPAVAAMVLAAAVKLVGTAWWDGLENLSLAGTNWVAVPVTLLFLFLLQKKKLGPVQTILGSGVVGAVCYALLQILVS